MDLHLVLDASALCVLLVLLLLLGKRHPESRVRLWFSGLLLVLGEAIAHALFLFPGPWHRASHVAALVFYLLAGQTFVYALLRPTAADRRLFTALFVSTVPQATVLGLYGWDLRARGLFLLCALAGVLLAIACSRLTAKPGLFITLKILGWSGFVGACLVGDYRFAVYWILFWVYLAVAVIAARRLPRPSTGRYAIVLGFGLWSLCFLTHSWVSAHPAWEPYVQDIWDLQKFLVTIGMLIVMLEAQVERNRDLALHDDLTGLPNRRLFDDRLSQAILQGARNRTTTGLIVIDLNGFKNVNDTLGHQAGDKLLCTVAENLAAVLRSSDTLARIGGDEFAIIVSNLRSSEQLLRHLEAALRIPITLKNADFIVTASIGLATAPLDSLEPETLFELADTRMYAQKQFV